VYVFLRHAHTRVYENFTVYTCIQFILQIFIKNNNNNTAHFVLIVKITVK